MLSTQERQIGEITLDKELGGKQLTKEVLEGLREEQRALLLAMADKNDEMIKVCKEVVEAEQALTLPEPSLSRDTERTVADIIVNVAPIKQAKINGEMHDLLMRAVDMDLGTLALVQRVCQRYGLSDYIRERLSNPGTHTAREYNKKKTSVKV